MNGGNIMIELSKISAKGQVTIPLDLRKKLQLTEGSKVAFITDENGRIYLANSSFLALKDVQTAFSGVAEALGIQSEDEVVDFIKSSLKD